MMSDFLRKSSKFFPTRRTITRCGHHRRHNTSGPGRRCGTILFVFEEEAGEHEQDTAREDGRSHGSGAGPDWAGWLSDIRSRNGTNLTVGALPRTPPAVHSSVSAFPVAE